MSSIHFLYRTYKKPLIETGALILIIMGVIFPHFWLLSVMAALVDKPNIPNFIDQWITATRTAIKYFRFSQRPVSQRL